jgi:hypothetical protein
MLINAIVKVFLTPHCKYTLLQNYTWSKCFFAVSLNENLSNNLQLAKVSYIIICKTIAWGQSTALKVLISVKHYSTTAELSNASYNLNYNESFTYGLNPNTPQVDTEFLNVLSPVISTKIQTFPKETTSYHHLCLVKNHMSISAVFIRTTSNNLPLGRATNIILIYKVGNIFNVTKQFFKKRKHTWLRLLSLFLLTQTLHVDIIISTRNIKLVLTWSKLLSLSTEIYYIDITITTFNTYFYIWNPSLPPFRPPYYYNTVLENKMGLQTLFSLTQFRNEDKQKFENYCLFTEDTNVSDLTLFELDHFLDHFLSLVQFHVHNNNVNTYISLQGNRFNRLKRKLYVANCFLIKFLLCDVWRTSGSIRSNIIVVVQDVAVSIQLVYTRTSLYFQVHGLTLDQGHLGDQDEIGERVSAFRMPCKKEDKLFSYLYGLQFYCSEFFRSSKPSKCRHVTITVAWLEGRLILLDKVISHKGSLLYVTPENFQSGHYVLNSKPHEGTAKRCIRLFIQLYLKIYKWLNKSSFVKAVYDQLKLRHTLHPYLDLCAKLYTIDYKFDLLETFAINHNRSILDCSKRHCDCLILMGLMHDIELNPGPSLTIITLNCRGLGNINKFRLLLNKMYEVIHNTQESGCYYASRNYDPRR